MEVVERQVTLMWRELVKERKKKRVLNLPNLFLFGLVRFSGRVRTSVHLNMASISTRRLSKELAEIRMEGCPVGMFTMIFGQDTYLSCFRSLGINLIEANDFSKWLLSIEVMGESLYMVRRMTLISRNWILYQRSPKRSFHPISG